MDLEGRVFWRDRTFPVWSGIAGQRAQEHSSYTGWARMAPHIEARGMRDYVGEGEYFGFNFGPIPEGIEPLGAAEAVNVPFSTEYARSFVFQPEYGVYSVHNRRGAHIDAETEGGPLFVTNILVQITSMRVVDARAGYRNVDIVGSGEGFLVTDGQYFPALWEKASHADPMQWRFPCGAPITLAPGKTWICILQDTARAVFE